MDVVGKTVTGMAKYIDREALVEWLKRIPIKDLSDGRGLCRVIFEDDFKRAIKKIPKGIIVDAPTVDAVEVVRCRECYHKTHDGSGRPYCLQLKMYLNKELDFFCKYGKRKEGAD